MAASAATCAVALVLAHQPLGNRAIVVAVAVMAALAERGSVRVGATTEVSISLIPTVFAGVLFGPLAALAVGAASNVVDLRRPYLKWVVYTSTRGLTGAASGATAMAAAGFVASPIGRPAIAAVAGGLVAEGLDVAFAATTHRLRGNGRVKAWIATHATFALASVALYTPVIALLALGYHELSPWTLLFFFTPAVAAQRLYVLYQGQRRLAQDLVSSNAHLERANLSFATALVTTLDARDRYTAGHSAAVAIYARDIAARMGLRDHDQKLAHLAGLVHDIGKVGLPPGLLEKPGALTLDERRQMERHSDIGARILAKVEDYEEIAVIVRHHHERVDGLGYPSGLRGDEIPLLSRIIAVADAYNAMTSDRPYRDAMPSRVARLRLAQAVESQFDTSAVAAFEAILAGSSESYRDGNREDFSLEAQDGASVGSAQTADAA